MGSAYQFHSWRVFVLVCAFPSVFAIGALTTQPESPRFFLEVTGLGPGLGYGEGSRGSCVQTPLWVGLAAFLPGRVHSLWDFILFPLFETNLQKDFVGGETRRPAQPWVA